MEISSKTKPVDITASIAGETVHLHYTETPTPDGRLQILGKWKSDSCGTHRIRMLIKADGNPSSRLQAKISAQIWRIRQSQPDPSAIQSPLTLLELYHLHYKEFFNSFDWASSTADKYDRDYRFRLLRGNLESKPAQQVTEEDIVERMTALANQRQKGDSSLYSRQETRMRDLWMLMCRFLAFLTKRDFLLKMPVSDRIRKSMTIEDDLLEPSAREMYNRRFSKQTLTRAECRKLQEAIEASDDPLALACGMMLFNGLRNGECAGQNWAWETSPGVLSVERQDEKDSDKKRHRSVTDRLKTKNAYRRLPCCKPLSDWMARQQEGIRRRHPNRTEDQLKEMPLLFVQTQKGRISPVPGERRATAKDVGIVGKRLLGDCLDKIMVNESDEDLPTEPGKREEALTAYALRHTYCTGLSAATDLTDEEIAYCMGHQNPSRDRVPLNDDFLQHLRVAHEQYVASFQKEVKEPEPFLTRYAPSAHSAEPPQA